MKKEKKLHIGTLDSIKGFKNISLDLHTYKSIYDLSQNNPFGIDLSVAKTIKFLYKYYSENEAMKKVKQLKIESDLNDAKILLNVDNNPKTIKGQKYKYMTAILYLAPAKISGFQVCPFADNCKENCLNTAGRGQMNSVQLGRINKTKWYFLERPTFMAQLHKEIKRHINRCERLGYKPAFRINGMSDLKIENMGLIENYPTAQWYDYTKNPIRMKKYIDGKFPSNYHLTFSLGSSNKKEAKEILKAGGNVAVVFRNKKLPKTFWGHKVFNADKTDLRFKDPKNVIAGLYAKGKARYYNTVFVQDV